MCIVYSIYREAGARARDVTIIMSRALHPTLPHTQTECNRLSMSSVYMHVCVYLCVEVYIWRERERALCINAIRSPRV